VRYLTAYERNQLRKWNIDLADLDKYGEMPVEYITGHVDFYQRDFFVNKNVLIPRIETEELFEKIVGVFGDLKESIPFLEVGTGSGALGISVFLELIKKGRVVEATLTDVSPDALQVAERNWQRLSQDPEDLDNVSFVEADLLNQVALDERLDFVVANLPYIPHERLNKLMPSVRDYEPMLALDGGFDGLELIKKLIKQLCERKFVGQLFLEIDDSHDKEIIQALLFSKKVEVWQDEAGKNRFAWLDFS